MTNKHSHQYDIGRELAAHPKTDHHVIGMLSREDVTTFLRMLQELGI